MYVYVYLGSDIFYRCRINRKLDVEFEVFLRFGKIFIEFNMILFNCNYFNYLYQGVVDGILYYKYFYSILKDMVLVLLNFKICRFIIIF